MQSVVAKSFGKLLAIAVLGSLVFVPQACGSAFSAGSGSGGVNAQLSPEQPGDMPTNDGGASGAQEADGGAEAAGDSAGGHSESGGGAAGRVEPAGGAAGGTGRGGGAGAPMSGSSGTAGGSGGPAAAGGPAVLQSGSHAFTQFQGPRCDKIKFSAPFSVAGAELSVHASVVTPNSHATHDRLGVWVEDITAAGFVGCVSEDAGLDNAHPDFRLDWLAYVRSAAPSFSALAGRAAIGVASGRSCQAIDFSPAFAARPQIQLRLVLPVSPSPGNRVSAVWAEQVTASGFRFCVEPLGNADASLGSVSVDWLAYPATLSLGQFVVGEHDYPAFDGPSCDVVATGCASCENAQLTINHHRRTEPDAFSHDPTLVWAEDMAVNGDLTICVQSITGYATAHDAHLSVGYLVRRRND